MSEKFTNKDVLVIKSKIDKAYFALAKIYVPFILALLLAYQLTKNKKAVSKMNPSDFDTIYWIVFGFFIIIFFVFFLRDYKKNIAPYKMEMGTRSKNLSLFRARKYFDPIYNQYLLYHPIKENKYILLTQEEFNTIEDGQEIELQVGAVTGIVLAIKVNDKVLTSVEEFSFS
jgi:hypothetical protein